MGTNCFTISSVIVYLVNLTVFGNKPLPVSSVIDYKIYSVNFIVNRNKLLPISSVIVYLVDFKSVGTNRKQLRLIIQSA